jgi:hypothetical protein
MQELEAKNTFDTSIYRSLEAEIGFTAEKVSGYEGLVNFKRNEERPIHRWYRFKEGYAADLVEKMLDEFKIPSNKLTLDLFSGSGTTVLSAQMRGMRTIAIDIDPFFSFVQRVKLSWPEYNVTNIKEEMENIKRTDMRKKPNLDAPKLSSFSGTRNCLFTPQSLRQLLLLKEIISKIKNTKTRELFSFALASILEDCSLAKKDGKGLKIIRKKTSKPIRDLLLDKLYSIDYDITETQRRFPDVQPGQSQMFTVDARNEKDVLSVLGPNKAGFVMFSPPYLNTFDYTEIYKLELWFLDFVTDYNEFKTLRANTLRSHNLCKWEPTKIWRHHALDSIIQNIECQSLWSKALPVMIQGYFDDMFLSLKNVNKAMEMSAPCIIVVGNSCYGNTPIPTDLLLSRVAIEAGFIVEDIRVARQRFTSSQQLKTLGNDGLKQILRESIIILRKYKDLKVN